MRNDVRERMIRFIQQLGPQETPIFYQQYQITSASYLGLCSHTHRVFVWQG